ncbi:nucleotide sugar dehydrogenase [Candidatus Absconditicoccus praedator]|uniref:nucleotide sugar dehydrogenase n=1 Tax=Candidatus Absconditicoccus praedator TaxID=2735562 RepID=UPI001E4201EE|nr:nucleotide sugar dehydrogenase [Candidatus Absconditicoccus praedator]UFX82754.1 nucleotide sugar dehydrogenase [Candidatus Absconditicoccus praedator]
MDKIVVIGMGYVGFPLACAIARTEKYDVYGLDIDESKINLINNKISPIEDKQAEKDIRKVKINATTNKEILKSAKYVLIAVPTPVLDDKNPDLRPLEGVCNMLSNYISKGMNIVVESTINPGVCEEILQPILESSGLKIGIDFELGHCPERINPGDEKWSVYNIPRNVGASTKKGTKDIADFYRSFLNAEVNEMKGIRHTEATKIIENTFRDINIAYVNELAKSFDKLGLDIVDVINGASNKPFAFMPHYPGCGVGGHCIPVDPYYLIERAKKAGFDHKFLVNAREVNNSMPEYLIEKLILSLNEKEKSIKGTKIALFGMSYKKDIGDMRESPSIEVKGRLEKLGADLTIYDPFISDYYNGDYIDIVKSNEALVFATNHTIFKKIEENIELLRGKVILDGRNFLNKDLFLKNGITYKGIGR